MCACLLYLLAAAARRAAVDLVVLQQPLGQCDAPQQVLNEALNADLPGRLLPGRRLQELLDGDHLPGGEEPGSPAGHTSLHPVETLQGQQGLLCWTKDT